MAYQKTPDAVARLTPEQYRVTQENGTERAFTGEYDHHFEPRIVGQIQFRLRLACLHQADRGQRDRTP